MTKRTRATRDRRDRPLKQSFSSHRQALAGPGRLAKLRPPRFQRVLARPRLFRLLDQARKRPLLWLVGPPGSGKTTLVASYVKTRRLPVLWYQLDRDDADVATFFHYMGLAVRQATPRKRQTLPHLQPEYRQGLSAFTQAYFRELFACLKKPSVIVLDNYDHVRADSLFHNVIRDGLNEIPKGLHAIVISRSGPPPKLARLRSTDSLRLLSWETLKLSARESAEIIRLRTGRTGSRVAERDFHQKAHGWAAGLVLLLEQDQEKTEPPSSIRNSAKEAIFDYFAEEIFQKTEARIKTFLLQTAFLSQMTGEMARALTGEPSAELILSNLNRRNYFIEKRAQPHPIYQYHPLFREFLLSRARLTVPQARLNRVQRKAAALLAEAGGVEDAVALLREAGRWKGVAGLVLNQARPLFAQGRTLTLEEWICSLPAGVSERDPWLQYWLGACRLPLDPARSRQHFEKAFELFLARKNLPGALRAWSDVVETIIYEWGDFKPLDKWISRLQELLQRHPIPTERELESRVAASMFFALMFRKPHHAKIEYWQKRALSRLTEDPDVNHRAMTGFHIALYHLWMGNLAEAAMMIDVLRESLRSGHASPLAKLTLCEAEAIYAWFCASREPCLTAVEEGFKIARTAGIHMWDYHLAAQAVYGTLSTGDVRAANKWLQKMASVLAKTRHLDISHYHYLSAWDALLRHDLPSALQHAGMSLNLALRLGTPFPEALTRLAMAQVLHEDGGESEAFRHLAKARRIGRNMGNPMLRYVTLLAEAHFLIDRSQPERSLKRLREAMAVGRKQGFFNTPWWRQDVMARLCVKALEAGIEVEYVRDLVRRRALVPESPPLHVENWPWAIKIHTLGSFKLLKDGRPLHFSRKVQQKPLMLLKVLIALGREHLPEEEIADALWPEAEGDAQHQALNVTLHRLRQLLGHGEALVVQGGQMTLDPRYCWVDIHAFDRLLDQALYAERNGEKQKAAELTEKALELYRGDFLAEETNETWAIASRERLRTKFLRWIVKLVSYLEEARRRNAVIEWCERGLEVEELAEELYQRLMLCYQGLGRRAEALSVYERCRKTLSAVLGVTPSPQTEAIQRSLRRERIKAFWPSYLNDRRDRQGSKPRG